MYWYVWIALALLFGSMIMSVLLSRVGFFHYVEVILTAGLPNPPMKFNSSANNPIAIHNAYVTEGSRFSSSSHLLFRICILVGCLSAIVTNDTTCVFITPIITQMCERYALPFTPFLLAIATCANIGSSFSPVGNPLVHILSVSSIIYTYLSYCLYVVCVYSQNMLISTNSHLGFVPFISGILLSALICLFLNMLLLFLFYRSILQSTEVRSCNVSMTRDVVNTQYREQQQLGQEEDVQIQMTEVEKQHINSPHPSASLPSSQSLDALPPSTSVDGLHHLVKEIQSQEEEKKRKEAENEPDIVHIHASPSSVTPILPSFSSAPLSPHYPDLNLSFAWAQQEYIRRVQLLEYYNIEWENINANNNKHPSSTRPSSPSPSSSSFCYLPPTAYILATTFHATCNKSHLLRINIPPLHTLTTPIEAPISHSLIHTPYQRFLYYLHTLIPSKLLCFNVILLGVIVAFLLGCPLSWTMLCGAVCMLVIDGIEPELSHVWLEVDWSLLIFFSALFIVVHGFQKSEFPLQIWNALYPILDLSTWLGVLLYIPFVMIGSNIVSNVPLVLLLAPHINTLPPGEQKNAWLLLAFISTLAGNLTLVGSVANLIVVQRAKPYYNLTFWEYFKFGFGTTIGLTLLGSVIMKGIGS